MAVDVTVSSDGILKAGLPHKLFPTTPIGIGATRNTWEVTPDGQRFSDSYYTRAEGAGCTALLVFPYGLWPMPLDPEAHRILEEMAAVGLPLGTSLRVDAQRRARLLENGRSTG
jgi:hypothetical protein